MIEAGEDYLHIEVSSIDAKPHTTLSQKYWQPLHDRILVKRIPDSSRTIVLTDAEKSKFAKVLAVGPGKWHDGEFSRTCVRPGDVVLVPGAGNKWPDWEDHDTILIQEADIGAIVG